MDDLRGDDADLDRIRELREALYAVVTARLTGVRTADRDRRLVNAAARATLVPELTGTGAVRWTGGLDGLLGAVARDALDLLLVRRSGRAAASAPTRTARASSSTGRAAVAAGGAA